MVIEIKAKLDAYNDLLARQHTISSLPKPGKREFRAYFDWFINEPPPVHDEFQYIYHMDDFLALGQQEDSWQGDLLDGISRIMPMYLKRRLLTSRATRSKTSDPNAVYYSHKWWELLIKAIVNLAVIGLLVLPTALLYLLNTK